MQDLLGNPVNIAGTMEDFAKLIQDGIRSPVKSTSSERELNLLRDSVKKNSELLAQMSKAISGLRADNKKLLSDNSRYLKEMVAGINQSIRDQKSRKTPAAKESRDEKNFYKHALKPGSIYTHDIRAVKHLSQIKSVLVKIAQGQAASIRLDKLNQQFRRSVAAQERKAGITRSRNVSGKAKKILDDYDYGDDEGSIKDILNEQKYRFKHWLKDFLGSSAVALGGIEASNKISSELVSNTIDFQKELSKVQAVLSTNNRIFGDTTKFSEELSNLYKREYSTGLSIVEDQQILLRLRKGGIKDEKDSLKLMNQAGRLAYTMGLDVGETAEMFSDMNRTLGLNTKETMQMAASIRETGKFTGLMGQSLSKAVHASKDILTHMRNIGGYSSSARDNIVKMVAAGEKFGVSGEMSKLQKLMVSGPFGLSGDKTDTWFMRLMAQAGGGVLKTWQTGGEFGPEENKKILGALKAQKAEYEALPKEQRALRARQMEASFGIGPGQIEQMIKAYEESGKTTEDRIKEMQARMGVMGNKERAGMETEIRDLRISEQLRLADQGKGNLNDAFTMMNQNISDLNKSLGKEAMRPIDANQFLKMDEKQKQETLLMTKEVFDSMKVKYSSPQEEANQLLKTANTYLAEIAGNVGAKLGPITSLLLGYGGASVLGGAAQAGGRWAIGKMLGRGASAVAGRAVGAGATGAAGAGGAGAAGAGAAGAGSAGAVGAGGRLAGLARGAGGLARFGLTRVLPVVSGAIGAYRGYTGAEEAGMGKIEGTTWGLLTGSAKSESGHWGQLNAAVHGASMGAAFGPHGALIGAGVSMLAEVGKQGISTYKESAAIGEQINKDADSRLMKEIQISEVIKKRIDLMQNDDQKVQELELRKKFLQDQIQGTKKEQTELQKEMDEMWFWERWGSQNDKLMNENARKLELKQGQVESLQGQIDSMKKGKMSPSAGDTAGVLRATRNAVEMASSNNEVNEDIKTVSDNTSETVDVLQAVLAQLQRLTEIVATSGGDIGVDMAQHSNPSYGRLNQNSREGSVTSRITYAQQV